MAITEEYPELNCLKLRYVLKTNSIYIDTNRTFYLFWVLWIYFRVYLKSCCSYYKRTTSICQHEGIKKQPYNLLTWYVILKNPYFIFQDVLDIIWKKWEMWHKVEACCKVSPNSSLLFNPRIDSYVKQCMRLTWRMVTQIPALEIEYKSSYLKQAIHKKLGYHSSPHMRTRQKGSSGQVPGEEIACYLWPGLLDGGGRLIRAGEVLCKMEDAY